MPVPLILLAAAAVVAAAGGDDDVAPPTQYKSYTTLKTPVWGATTVPGQVKEPGRELGPPVTINRVIVANFIPTPGEYGEAEMPQQCAEVINWCTPKITLPLGFPSEWIPAKPMLVELAQADGPMVVWGAVATRARTGGDYQSNEVAQGDLNLFKSACFTVGYFGEAGTTGTSDVPVSNVAGDGTVASPECALAQSPSIPRLTVVKTGVTRRLMLFVPAHKGSFLRIQVTVQYRVVR